MPLSDADVGLEPQKGLSDADVGLESGPVKLLSQDREALLGATSNFTPLANRPNNFGGNVSNVLLEPMVNIPHMPNVEPAPQNWSQNLAQVLVDVINSGSDLVSGLTSPLIASTAAVGPVVGPLGRAMIGAGYAGQMGASGVEQGMNVYENAKLGSTEVKQAEDVGALLQTMGMLGLLGAGHAKDIKGYLEPQPPLYQAPRSRQLVDDTGTVPQQKLLTGPNPEAWRYDPRVIDLPAPLQLPIQTPSTFAEKVNPQPVQAQVRSETPVAPPDYRLGREQAPVIPPESVEQLVQRGYAKVGGREDIVRPSQQAPQVIGEQPSPTTITLYDAQGKPVELNVRSDNRTGQIEPVYSKSPMQVEGGKLPSHGEFTAGSQVTETQGGQPSSGVARATDAFREPMQSPVKGMLTPEQPKAKGMQIKAAMERGQKRRGNTGAINPTGGEGKPLEPTGQKQDLAAKVRPMSAQQFMDWSRTLPAGITTEAHKYGRGATSQAQVEALKEGELAAKQEMVDAMQKGDMDGAMSIAVKGQFFREAHEAATGTGSAKLKFDREEPGWKPPFPQQTDKGMGSSLSTKPALLLRDGRVIEGKQGGMHFEILDQNPSFKESDVLDGGVVKEGKYYPRNSEMTAGQNTGASDQALVDRYTKQYNEKKQSGGIGGGIKKAIEKNKESGSIANPFFAIIDKFKNKEKAKRDIFATDAPRFLLNPKESGFANPTKEVDAQQLVNRVKNKVNKAEVEIYEKSGVLDEIRKLGKVSPEKAAEMLQENGPEVKVESYGMEGKVSEAKKEYDRLKHEYDTEGKFPTFVPSRDIQEPGKLTVSYYDTRKNKDTGPIEVSEKEYQRALKWDELGKAIANEPIDRSPRATSAYNQVSPLPTTEPMPEWTKTKSGKNVQRVDVVVPNQTKAVEKELITGSKYTKNEPLWQPDNLHENLPNTLGWAMIQYKTGPDKHSKVLDYAKNNLDKQKTITDPTGAELKYVETPDGIYIVSMINFGAKRQGGATRLLTQVKQLGDVYLDANALGYKDALSQTQLESFYQKHGFHSLGDRKFATIAPKKIAVIAEAQSRWGQERRSLEQKLKQDPMKREITVGEARTPDHPLLRDYNRLILKAVIEQARKEGATHIMVSDAETAMMTEGHDTNPDWGRPRTIHDKLTVDEGDAILRSYVDKGWLQLGRKYEVISPDKKEHLELLNYGHGEKGWRIVHENAVIPQEPGMRLNYDTILPKIAEELTGSKGERVSLGEHKNAFDINKVQIEPTVENKQKIKDWYGSARMSNSNDPLLTWAKSNSDESFIVGSTIAKNMGVDVNNISSRENLIFRNPDGTPKTSISGLLYSLDKVPDKSASLFEKDRPETRGAKVYGGIPFLDPDFWKAKPGVVGGIQTLKDYASEKADATKALGVGALPQFKNEKGVKVPVLNKELKGALGLGRLFDPRSYKTTPVEQSMLTHQAQVNKGVNMTALWLESRKGVKRAFETDKEGKVTLADGSKGYMSDVIESELMQPGSQKLTPLQKQFVGWWRKQLEATKEMLDKEGVEYVTNEDGSVVVVSDVYFPRPAIGKEGVEGVESGSAKTRVGTEQFFQKERQYVTEQMGASKGIKYEPDEYGRIGRYLKAVYRSIADKRLATDPVMKGRPGRPNPSYMDEGIVYHPAFHGRVFDAETAKKINDYYNSAPSKYGRMFQNANDFLKSMKFTADVSAPLNQGLAMMGSNPVRWAKATLKSYQALFDDKTLAKYLGNKENLQAAQEIVANGGNVAHLYDNLQGAQEGRLAHRVAFIRASGRSMGTFLSIAKIELYKAWKPLADAEGWSKAELVEAIENSVFSGKMEGLGLSQSRAMTERLIFNAPSYMRGGANLVAMAAQGGASGKVARRALLGLGTAILTQVIATYLSQRDSGELSQEEMMRRLDPRQGDFLRVSLPVGRVNKLPDKALSGKYQPVELTKRELNDRIEVSYGNILLSTARILGETVDIATGDKELGSGSGNPAIRFMKYRTSPMISLAAEIWNGADYRGEKVGLGKSLLKTALPVNVEPFTEKNNINQRGVKEAVLGTMGLNTFPESIGDKRKRLTDATINQLYGKKRFEDLTFPQRAKVMDKVDRDLEQDKKQPISSTQTTYALDRTKKLAEKLQKKMDESVRAEFELNGLTLSGFKSKHSFGKGAEVAITDKERDQLTEYIAVELNKRLKNVMQASSWNGLSVKQKQERVNKIQELVVEAAWGKYGKHLKENNSSSKLTNDDNNYIK